MQTVYQRIQPSEYYRRFLEFQIRPDGRHPGAVRDVRIMKNVLQGPALGSAIISAGHSRFLIGVTAEIAPPCSSAPKSGRIVINVEFPKSCGADVSREGGGEESSNLAAQASISLGHIFCSPEVIDLTQFCIKEGSAVWVLYVNAICLEFDGNVIDWCLCGIAAALEDTVLPTVHWDLKQQWWQISDATSDDDETRWDGRTVQLLARPSSVTFAKLLDTFWVVDPTLDELQLGDPLTVWRSGAHSRLHLLRPGGAALDVQVLLHSLFEVSRAGMEAMESAISRAMQDFKGDSMWEVCCSDNEEDQSS